jgi:hypothetical protein
MNLAENELDTRIDAMIDSLGVDESDLAIGIMCQGKQYPLRELMANLIYATFMVVIEETKVVKFKRPKKRRR